MDEAELAKMDEMDFAGVEELAEDTPNFEKAALKKYPKSSASFANELPMHYVFPSTDSSNK
ncbi:hypothetical protein OS493_029717 [Desmophyllum pertusum]|uniref:Uncharacterized protein n=1 Tax=Desmophyllum pertusum TaxID=174260 RepID=A0A9W9Z8Y2_9CNID|nr:hypothetical protein OS493_029717 [Desmophyllum pertusum]